MVPKAVTASGRTLASISSVDEKKSSIVEKQVAAEIRKLKMAQSQSQKLADNEERVRLAKGRKERAEGKQPDAPKAQKKKNQRKSKASLKKQ